MTVITRSTGIALAFLAMLMGSAAQAMSFQAVHQQRSISIDGSITVVDEIGDVTPGSEQHDLNAPAGDFGSFDQSVGIDVHADAIDGSASATAQGHASQKSVFGGDFISFDGEADVFASGTASPLAFFGGNGSASSLFNLTFDVADRVPVLLTLDSATGAGSSGDYDFLLRRGSTVLWDDAVLPDPVSGGEIRSFSRSLWLDPGRYTLRAGLRADALSTPDFFSAGRVLGSFSLAAVPEPGTSALILGGLACAAMAFKLRRKAAGG